MKYDMVVEGMKWFEFQGSPCASRTLTVIEAFGYSSAMATPSRFFVAAVCILALPTVMTAGAEAPQPDINLAAFANGALVESSTSDYDSGWQARWITDESPATGWSSAQNAAGPFAIVMSLPGR